MLSFIWRRGEAKIMHLVINILNLIPSGKAQRTVGNTSLKLERKVVSR